MATTTQLKALLKAHFEQRNKDFESIALQISANKEKKGHLVAAKSIRTLVERSKGTHSNTPIASPIPLGKLEGVLFASQPTTKLKEMFTDTALSDGLKRVFNEQANADKLKSHGLTPKRKLLLVGAPGTGKTMTASVLASELNLPLYQVRLDGLITSFMGETAARLRQVFDYIAKVKGVYFFDEFDALGSDRSIGRDLGEMRRILNSLLTMIEQDTSESLIVCATNHANLLDSALFRRFDDLLLYTLPEQALIVETLKERLKGYTDKAIDWEVLARAAKGLSQAELLHAAEDAIKYAVLNLDGKAMPAVVITEAIKKRHAVTKQYASTFK